ncbi:protein of unknown function [Bradyrhizobium vignae]|uniref:Uncharacterized protein n=1 Tax=Bradyrhizobium vignae TaxID=1549949 RepID=A0A2U3Q9M0_9BRAD|nr:protein of unknown function [Bradyrhizobium vignae]
MDCRNLVIGSSVGPGSPNDSDSSSKAKTEIAQGWWHYSRASKYIFSAAPLLTSFGASSKRPDRCGLHNISCQNVDCRPPSNVLGREAFYRHASASCSFGGIEPVER